jgi:hypothetical protein
MLFQLTNYATCTLYKDSSAAPKMASWVFCQYRTLLPSIWLTNQSNGLLLESLTKQQWHQTQLLFFIMAEHMFINTPTITGVHPNTHVFWVGKEETTRGYSFHIYHPSGYKQFNKDTVPVTHHNGHWHVLKHEKTTKWPILGARCDNITEYDKKLSQDLQKSEDMIEEEDTLSTQIRNTLLPAELSPSLSMATQTQTATTVVIATALTTTTFPNDLRESWEEHWNAWKNLVDLEVQEAWEETCQEEGECP